WTSPQFPWATFTINVTGSFLIGFFTVGLARWLPHPNFRLLLITGFLGGYTTFSTFENDALNLWERGEGWLMSANVVGSVVLGFVAVVLGTAAARGLAGENFDRHVASTPSVAAREEDREISARYQAAELEKDDMGRRAVPADLQKSE